MLWDEAKDAKIRLQEKQIQELEYALRRMQERADAIEYYLEEHCDLNSNAKRDIQGLLAPLYKSDSRPRIFRDGKNSFVSSTDKGMYFHNPQSKDIDDLIESKIFRAINTLYKYLQGTLPKGVECFAPKLSEEDAFSVIWFLQECIGCLPSKYERCDDCGDIYNSEAEGHHSELNGKSYCGGCWDSNGEVTLCWDCATDIFTEDSRSEEYNEYLCEECKKERDEKKKNKENDDAEDED